MCQSDGIDDHVIEHAAIHLSSWHGRQPVNNACHQSTSVRPRLSSASAVGEPANAHTHRPETVRQWRHSNVHGLVRYQGARSWCASCWRQNI